MPYDHSMTLNLNLREYPFPCKEFCCCHMFYKKEHLDYLNDRLAYVEATPGTSHIASYDGDYLLSMPQYVKFAVKDSSRGLEYHNITYDCTVGNIIDKWAAPLYVYNVTCDNRPVNFVFIHEDTDHRSGSCQHPHIVLDTDENYVRHKDLLPVVENELMRLIDEWNDVREFNTLQEKLARLEEVPTPGIEPNVPNVLNVPSHEYEYIEYCKQYLEFNDRKRVYDQAQLQIKEIKNKLKHLIPERTDAKTFFQYYLSKCTDLVHVRHLLCYLPSLHIASGK